MVAAGLVLAAVGPSVTRAREVEVRFVSDSVARRLGERGAAGLLLAGRGGRTSRAEALALLDLDPFPSCAPAAAETCIRIALSLPPSGRRPNNRYRLAFTGRGYHGRLVSDRTRVPGLVSIADIAPTVRALREGRRPPVTAAPDADAPTDLTALDHRIDRAHAVRIPAVLLLMLVPLAAVVATLLLRSPLLARAALLGVPFALAASLVASEQGVDAPWLVALAVGLAAGPAALTAAAFLRRPRELVLPFLALFGLYLVDLTSSSPSNSLSAFGPHLESGGRFYGISNRVETLLLVPALLPPALLGLRALPVAAGLAFATVGLSATGADGGGILVLAAAYLVLLLRVARKRLTPRNAGAVALAAAGIALALVGLDAAAGGSSHVTRAVGKGPAGLGGDLAHRLHISLESVTSSAHQAFFFLLGAGFLAWLATVRPRSPVRDALLVALVVSLLVNDSPVDVAGFGALSCVVLWNWERLASSPASTPR